MPFCFYYLIPLLIAVTYVFSSAHILLYLITFSIYYPLVIVSLAYCRIKFILPVTLCITSIVIYSRINPIQKSLNPKDSTICSIFEVHPGESIEQDFFLPKSDWKFKRALKHPHIDTIVRLLVDSNADDSDVYIDNTYLGKISSLLMKRSEHLFYCFPVYNYIIKVPKELLKNKDRVSLRVTAHSGFKMAYSSGVHPLPRFAHCRLIDIKGNRHDLSEKYYHRRFRFQNVIYFISNKFYTEKDNPLILGALL